MPLFKVTGLLNNEQAITNCCYANTDTITELSGSNTIPDEGVMCAIRNRFYYVRPCDQISKGSIAIGLIQRGNCKLRIGDNCEVITYTPYPALLRNQIEILITNLSITDYASKTIDNDAFSKHIKETYKGHIFCTRDKFVTVFQEQMYLVEINELVGSSTGTFDEHTNIRILRVPEYVKKYGIKGPAKTEHISAPRRSSRLSSKAPVSYKY